MLARMAGSNVVPREAADRPGNSAEARGSGGLRGVAAAGVRRHGQADDQSVAAHGASPFLAVAVRHIRAARRLRVKLLEQPLLTASVAVPAQLRHPGNLLGAISRGLAGVEGVDADSGTLLR